MKHTYAELTIGFGPMRRRKYLQVTIWRIPGKAYFCKSIHLLGLWLCLRTDWYSGWYFNLVDVEVI